MKDSKTLTLTRTELMWLYRQLSAGKDRAMGVIKQYSGDAISMTRMTEEQRKLLAEAEEHKEALEFLLYGRGTEEEKEQLAENKLPKDKLDKVALGMKDILAAGDRARLALRDVEANLNEAFGLVEEDSAKQAIMDRLKNLPKEEPYRIAFDRTTAKFTLRLVENDLLKFKTHVIPNYEKAKPEEFTDPIQTKSFWVNKSKKSKVILEQLKLKLERVLS